MTLSSLNFWVASPCILVTDIQIFPTKTMTKTEKLNALTRLTIIITILMYVFDFKYWLPFLFIALISIILLEYHIPTASSITPPVTTGDIVENFTRTPTYSSCDMHQTVVAPLFAEEWQIPPPVYDIIENAPVGGVSGGDTFYEPPPRSYPYGQYLTRTNLLPQDEYQSHMLNGGVTQAREYANSATLRHDMAYRENMTRILKKRMARRFRNNCNDVFSPFSSY